MGVSHDRENVKQLLIRLHDTPVASDLDSDTILGPTFSFLTSSSSASTIHWFCELADPLVVEAATFLLRLFAYKGAATDIWKEKFHSCLSKCVGCVQGLEEVKVTSRTTYFGAFAENILDEFYKQFEEWELNLLLEDVAHFKLNDGAPANSEQARTLSSVPSAIVYRMVSNWTIFNCVRIQALIHTNPPTSYFSEWPTNILPPGILILTMDHHPDVRKWARGQMSHCSTSPLPEGRFYGPYVKALGTILHAISLSSLPSGPDMQRSVEQPLRSFALDSHELWSGFVLILKLIPINWLKSGSDHQLDLRRVVIGHLHDDGSHFSEIFRCAYFLIKRLGEHIWEGEDPSYPLIVFDSIKDNAAFLQMLQQIDPRGDRPWFLNWFPEYLHTLRALPIYEEVLARMTDFLCEEIQHERFRDARSMIMDTAAQLLLSAFRKSKADPSSKVAESLFTVLDIHSEVLVAVAFGKEHKDEKWKNARNSTRTLVTNVLSLDVQQVLSFITSMCRMLANLDASTRPEIPILSVRNSMWNRVYQTIQTSAIDDGLSDVLCVVAKAAHIHHLRKKPWVKILDIKNPGPSYSTGEKALDEVNKSLAVICGGILKSVSKFADYNVSSSALNILQRPGVVNAVITMLISPVEDFHMAAQAFVGLAFDVDVRLDCFRALLENLPDASLLALLDFLEKFIQYAPSVPEACDLSKSLVRCFTDIIEVLCANPDGLLHNPAFLQSHDKDGPASRLFTLWDLMTKSLSVIFKRTPSWSVSFENEDMILWMRDALIFGRDLLAQWRTIENAANSLNLGSSKSSRKLSEIGKKMVASLQEVLLEVIRWLRLTDEELLHQSFALIESLFEIFRDTHTSPSQAVTEKLTRHVNDARKNRSGQSRSRLDESRLSKLENTLAYYDDEIQIISHTIATDKKSKDKKEHAKPKLSDDDIEIISAKDKPKNIRTPPIPAPLAPKPLTSQFFSAKDKEKLEGEASAMPAFRKSSTNIQESTDKRKTSLDPRKVSRKEPKNEGMAKPMTSESSDDSDSSSSEEERPKGGVLASLGRIPKIPKIPQPEKRRQVMTLDMGSMLKSNPMQERINRRQEARKVALRLKPDISGLHKNLLSWSYDHQGPYPPGEQLQPLPVPAKFDDYNHYRRVFEPLLLLECWAQILNTKEDQQQSLQEAYNCKIGSRQHSGQWLDIDITIMDTVRKDWYLAETDVILLRHPVHNKSILAKTQNYRANMLGTQANIRCYLPNGTQDPGLQMNTIWSLRKVFSLSTLHREYAALISLPYYDYFETILQPQLPKTTQADKKEVARLMSSFSLNEPQAAAIINSMQSDGFSLIQGPPGTGKTSTICGLVAFFLSRRRKPSVPIYVGRNATTSEKEPVAKVLICAPSNAAIDEIAQRLKNGYRGSVRGPDDINVVRIGTAQSMNVSVKDISLDHLVDEKLEIENSHVQDHSSEISTLRQELTSIKNRRQEKIQELSNVHDNRAKVASLENEIKQLNSRRMDLSQQFDRLKDQQKSDSRTLDAVRRKARQEILRDADVICSTLSGAGHEVLENFDFEMVIIDEAAQAVELSSLIPLKYRSLRCIMVGDPQQLPPTVLSHEAGRFKYNQSLFVRFQQHRPDAVHLLSIQYRMHPEISRLPSQIFYQGRLQDGPGMAESTTKPWHQHSKFGVYKFFNVSRGIEEQSGQSIKNTAECQVAVALYNRLRQEFSTFNFSFRIGVISMYRAQITELRRQFEQRFGRDITRTIDFNTVDGFQGQEKDIIILSCVRAGPGLQTVGFLSDTRRMNVALTRAKSSLFILGNAPTLERSDQTWRDIVSNARTRQTLVNVDTVYFTRASSPRPPSPPSSKTSAKAKPGSSKIPGDLVTPQQFKSTTHDVSTTSLVPSKRKSESSHNASSSSTPRVHQEPNPKGTKRPIPHDPTLDQQQRNNEHPNDTNKKQKPPPPKRPKQQPNIFIPSKNKNKRP